MKISLFWVKSLFCFISLYFFGNVLAFNPNTTDSLLQVLKGLPADTQRVNVLVKLADNLSFINTNQALSFAGEAIELAHKLHFKKGEAFGLLQTAFIKVRQGFYTDAAENIFTALKIGEDINNQSVIAFAYFNMGSLKRYQSEYDAGLEYYRKSYAIREKLKDKYGMAFSLNGIGNIFYFKKDYKTSQVYYRKSAKLRREINDIQGLATSYHNIGVNYCYLKDTLKALAFQDTALVFAGQSGDKNVENSIYNLLGDIYIGLKQPDKALYYLDKGRNLAHELNAQFLLVNIYERVSKAFVLKNDYKKAYYYHLLYKQMLDKVEDEKSMKQIERMRYDYELEKKEKEILIRDSTIQKQHFAVILIGVVLLSLGIFLVLLYRSYKIKQRDHQQLSHQQQEILLQNIRLAELNSLKNQLFSIITHDFRNPLHALQGILNLLKEDALSPEEIKYLTTELSDKLGITLNLLENLLHWAKSQMDGVKIQTEIFDIKVLADENATLLKSQALRKQITIYNEITDTVKVFADAQMINIVIRNLMTNAVKFTNSGGSVWVFLEVKSNQVSFYVKDNGLGISEENVHNLFSPTFTTLGSAKEKGTGLGLMLCKDFIEKNGGTLQVESKQGEGSTFSFTLPVYTP
jgi:signal transduction histidine kinase